MRRELVRVRLPQPSGEIMFHVEYSDSPLFLVGIMMVAGLIGAVLGVLASRWFGGDE